MRTPRERTRCFFSAFFSAVVQFVRGGTALSCKCSNSSADMIMDDHGERAEPWSGSEYGDGEGKARDPLLPLAMADHKPPLAFPAANKPLPVHPTAPGPACVVLLWLPMCARALVVPPTGTCPRDDNR